MGNFKHIVAGKKNFVDSESPGFFSLPCLFGFTPVFYMMLFWMHSVSYSFVQLKRKGNKQFTISIYVCEWSDEMQIRAWRADPANSSLLFSQ